MHPESILHDPWRDWLAAALRGERPAWNGGVLGTIEDLLESAESEGVAALVDAALHGPDTAWSLPRALDEGFATAAREQIAVELMRRGELTRVIQSLAAADIPALVLKGGALAYSIYPAAHLRPRIDIDVLVPDADAAERSKPALAALGYVASQVPTTAAIGYELILRREAPGGYVHWIDVHWALANQALYAGVFGFDELAAEAIALPALGEAARGLHPVHALLHACMHRVANLPTGDGDRLIWLYDIDLLARRFAPSDFTRLLDLAQPRGVAGTCRDGLRQTMDAFATSVPAGLLEALERSASSERFDIRKARSRWYQEWHNLRALPMRKRLAWTREKLFPDPSYMRQRYLVHSGWALLLAYVRRFGTGLRMLLRGRVS